MQGLPSWSREYNLQLVQLMESHPVPGDQLWFYPHLCMWSTHRGLVLRLPCSSWVCPCEDQAQRWYDCLDHRRPGGSKCTRKPAAMGTRDMAPVRAFSGTQHKVHDGQPWPGFFWCLAAGTRGPALRGLFYFYCPAAGAWGPALRRLFLLLISWRKRASPEQASFIIISRQRHVGRKRLQ